jgi:group I intron endonuclease
MKDNAFLLSKIPWYSINDKGYIDKLLKYEPAVYIYKKLLRGSKPCYYVGSSIKLASRISSHRCHVKNWNKYKNRGSPIFYRTVLKYGWSNFQFGILEFLDESKMTCIEQRKKAILKREQYYLDNINPSMNICKMAGSPLEVKRNIISTNLSKTRGKK